MSRLAPVTTGHPTQGIGAAPLPAPTAVPLTSPATDSPIRATPRRTAPPPQQQYASPLEAQRAEAEAAEALSLADAATPPLTIPDLEVPPPSTPSTSSAPSTLSSRDPYANIRHTAAAAWLTLEAKEIEVRKYFREIPKETGLALLAKMRHQCDLAAETLQQRMDEGNTERCTGCGKTLEEARKSQWIMMGSDVDPGTGVPVPYRFCGPLCVRERNREKMLPPEMRDQKRFDGADIAEVR